MKTCDCFRYWWMGRLFMRETVSESGPFVMTILKGNHARSAIPGHRHLSQLSIGGWWRSVSSSSFLVLFCSSMPRPLIRQPFYAMAGPKQQTIAPYLAEHYVSCWKEMEWPPMGVLEAFSSKRTFRKCGANINSSVRSTSPIPRQYEGSTVIPPCCIYYLSVSVSTK